MHRYVQDFLAPDNFQPLCSPSPLPLRGGLWTLFGLQASWFRPMCKVSTILYAPHLTAAICRHASDRSGGHRRQVEGRCGFGGWWSRTSGTLTKNACSGAQHKRYHGDLCQRQVPWAIPLPAVLRTISLMFGYLYNKYLLAPILWCALSSSCLRGQLCSCSEWNHIWTFHTLGRFFNLCDFFISNNNNGERMWLFTSRWLQWCAGTRSTTSSLGVVKLIYSICQFP